MDIQARKLVLIEEFLQINDETLIAQLELIIRKEKKISKERRIKPLSLNEFHEMIDLAIQDSDAGRVIAHEELKKKVETWK